MTDVTADPASAEVDTTPEHDEVPRDAVASSRLRQVEDAKVISRRGVLWRAAGIATGVAALTALDVRRVEAADGGNIVIGSETNSAQTTTALLASAYTGTSPLMKIDGSNLGQNLTVASDALLVVSQDGRNGLRAQSAPTNATFATTGLAIWGEGQTNGAGASSRGVYGSSPQNIGVQGSSTSSYGVYGSSSSGEGVYGSSSSKYGVHGKSTSSSGVYGEAPNTGYAIRGSGRVRFDKVSGVATIVAGNTTKTVTPGVPVNSASFVLLTPMNNLGGRSLWVTLDTANDKFIIHMSDTRGSDTKVGWLQMK